MAALDLQEQEQLAEFKAWWDKRGNLVLTTLIIIFLVIAAYNGWRYYQRSQSLAAGAVFEQLQAAKRQGQGARIGRHIVVGRPRVKQTDLRKRQGTRGEQGQRQPDRTGTDDSDRQGLHGVGPS